MVEPRNGGLIPRYSASPSTDNRLWVVAREQPVDVLQFQAAIVERAPDSLRHQIEDGEAIGHLAEVGFRDADDCRAAALEPFHHAPSTGAKTG